MANNKDILLVVRADTKDADQKLGTLDEKLSNVEGSGKTAGDVLKDLGEKAKDAGDSTEELNISTEKLGSFLGGVVAGGAALAVQALFKLSMEYISSNEKIENLTQGVKDNWGEVFKATQEWNNFRLALEKFTAEELLESLNGIDMRVSQIGNKMLGFFSTFIQIGDYLGITDFAGELDKLKKEQDLIEKQIELNKEGEALKEMSGYNLFKELGVYEDDPWKVKAKNIKEANKELLDYYTMINKIMDKEKLDDPEMLPDAIYLGNGYGNARGSGNASSKNKGAMGAFSKGYMENLKLVEELTRTSADVLRSEFSSAWQDIFGEANSLFEKLMMNIAEQLANRAINSLFGSLLNFILPGAGTLAGMATGSVSNPQAIVLQMDNQTMAKWYVGGKNQAGRLRLD